LGWRIGRASSVRRVGQRLAHEVVRELAAQGNWLPPAEATTVEGLWLSFSLADSQPKFLSQEGEEVDESEEDNVGWSDREVAMG
jgi:hypothetical protein